MKHCSPVVVTATQQFPALLAAPMPISSQTPRPKRSPALRRAPRLARLRRSLPAHSNRNIALAGRMMRPASALSALLLAGLLVRGWSSWRLDLAGQIERATRAQTIPQLEKQLGQKIEVGSFSTDWLGRVQVEDIVVGRSAKLPTGALIGIKRATLSLDLVGLALGRNRFPGAITAVDLDSPSLYVRRDARGKLNLASLLKSSSGGGGTRWSGRIGLTNARVFYLDEKIRSRADLPLELDARGANATIFVSSPRAKSSAIEFDGQIAQTFLRGQNLGALPLRGRAVSADKTPTRGWLETQTPFLPVALANQWAPTALARGVQARSGTLGGRVQVAFVGSELAPRGEVELRGVSLLWPRAGAASIPVDGVSGPLRFAGSALQTTGLSARVAGANWTVKGRAAFDAGQTVFDGDIGTRNLSLARARALIGPNDVTATLRASLSQVNAAGVDVDAHASGTPASVRAQATVAARDATWNDGRGHSARCPLLRATGVLTRSGGAPPAFAARFEAPGGEVRARLPRVQNVSVRAAKWSGTLRSDGRAFDLDARGDAVAASSDVVGQSAVSGLHLVASSPDLACGQWRGGVQIERASTQNVRLAALFPRASLIQSSGLLSGRFDFEGSPGKTEAARASGRLSLSGAALSPDAVPPEARAQLRRVLGANFSVGQYLSARDLGAEVSLRNGVLEVTNARAQTAGGQVLASFSTPIQKFAPRYAFSSPRLSVPPAFLIGAARARGLELSGNWNASGSLAGEGDAHSLALRALVTMRAPRFSARSVRGGARLDGSGAALQVAADLEGAAPRWSAELSCASLDVRGGVVGSTGLSIPRALDGARVAGARIVAASLGFPGARGATSRTARLTQRIGTSARATTSFGANILSAWTMRLGADRVSAPLRGVAGIGAPVVTLRDINALVNPRAGGVNVSRLSAHWSDAGRIDGHFSLDKSGARGEVLAREIEARSLGSLLPRAQLAGAQLAGRLSFKAALRPGAAPQLDAQMNSGALALPMRGRALTIPIRALNIRVQTQNGVLSFQNARAFVGGASFEASGRALLKEGKFGVQLSATNLSLSPIARLLDLPASMRSVAGMARARVNVGFDARRNLAVADGRVHVDGGAFRGVSLDQTDARIEANWNLKRKQGALKVSDWRGQLEGAPFSGNVALDTAKNSWSLQLSAPRVALQTAARIKARIQNATATDALLQRLAPPVAGTASAVVDVSGTLRDKNNRFSPRPHGVARLNVLDLQWRAQHLGEVNGTFNVADGRLAFAPLTLSPPTESGENALGAPTIALVGSVPLDGRGPLDARLSVGEAPLEFFLQTLQEGRDALGSSNLSSPFLESVVSYGAKLPRGLRGRVALEAQVGGTFASPVFKVSRLALRDGRAPLPMGGLSLPATFDAAFTFASGEVTFDRAQFRLAKTERDANGDPIKGAPPDDNPDAQTKATVAGAAPPDPNPDSDEDDTLVQIQGGSKLSLEGDSSLIADVFNANLSQLSPWVPALRGKNGETLLRGQLEGFSVRLEGPARDPRLTASVDAQNITFRGVTLARLRVARLDIGDGVAKIEPGNLSVKEGRFESSAASGSVAWSWTSGPVADGALRLRFPFATRDFGALAALFLPGISGARADGFAGTIEVGGTVSAPQFQGDLQIKDASFQTVSTAASPLAVGVQHLSGALRFVNGNQLEIAPDNPIKGELVAPETVASLPAAPTKAPVAGKNGKKPRAKIVKSVENNALRARGAFQLGGTVELRQTDLLQVAANVPLAIASNVYDLRLDVSKARVDAPGASGLQDAALAASFATSDPTDAANTQTLRWIGAGRGTAASKKVGGGDLFTRGALRLRRDFLAGLPSIARSFPLAWTSGGVLESSDAAKRAPDSAFADARPQLIFKGFGAKFSGYGSAVVDGDLVLDQAPAQNRAPDAARLQTISGAPALHPLERPSGARLFGAWNETAQVSPVKARLPLVMAEDARLAPRETNSPNVESLPIAPREQRTNSPIALPREPSAESSAANPVPAPLTPRQIEGRIVSPQLAPREVESQNAASSPSMAPREIENQSAASSLPIVPRETGSQSEEGAPRFVQNDEPGAQGEGIALRVGGNLVVSNAQIVGGGKGTGPSARLSLLPDAPRLDVRLSLGRDVEVVNSTVRARLGGEVALSGTPSNPLLLGTVEVLDGQVRFPNARARIEDGRVSINLTRDAETDLPRARLEVDATARGQSGRYAITLKLHGPLQFDARDSQNTSNLKVEVTSNPSLSQDEAFAQLLGVSPRDFSNGNGHVNVGQANQAYAQAVLQVVSAPLFSGFERSVAQTLGLSNVSFEYRFNEPLAFELSKSLGDRISITYRRSLGATQISDGRTPFQLRFDYRLRGDFYLGAQLDERQVKTLTLGKSWRF